MKKSTVALSLITLLTIGVLTTPSCKKYEEGPGISLMSKKARLTGKWKVDREIEKDGSVEYGDGDKIIEFKKDGQMIISSASSGFALSLSGTWEFNDSKDRIITRFSFLGSSSTNSAKIILLKNRAFATEDDDGDKTYFVAVD